MTRENSDPEFGYTRSLTTPQEQVIGLLLETLQKLADTGEVDAACRVAGKACVVLRRSDAKSERRFNALLHRLANKMGSIERGKDCE